MTNRFKGLDLIDKVPEELWTVVCNIVQKAVTKTIPKKKKCKKAKWLSELALQISEKRRERQRNQRSNSQHPLDHGKSKRVPEKEMQDGKVVV